MTRLGSLLRRPLMVGSLFAPLAAAVWLLLTQSLGLDSHEWRAGVRLAQWALLISGLLLFALSAQGLSASARRGRDGGWLIAVAALAVVVATHLILIDAEPRWFVVSVTDDGPNWAEQRLVSLGLLTAQILLTGAAEELWFRGLWMRAAGERFWLSVGVGALAFGLYHWPHGAWVVVTTLCLGVLYGVARWRGAPIWALAVAHGFGNWFALYGAPGPWRGDPQLSQAAFCAFALLGAAAIFWLWRPRSPEHPG